MTLWCIHTCIHTRACISVSTQFCCPRKISILQFRGVKERKKERKKTLFNSRASRLHVTKPCTSLNERYHREKFPGFLKLAPLVHEIRAIARRMVALALAKFGGTWVE